MGFLIHPLPFSEQFVNNTRKDIEQELGESIITQENVLYYQYQDKNKKMENK